MYNKKLIKLRIEFHFDMAANFSVQLEWAFWLGGRLQWEDCNGAGTKCVQEPVAEQGFFHRGGQGGASNQPGVAQKIFIIAI